MYVSVFQNDRLKQYLAGSIVISQLELIYLILKCFKISAFKALNILKFVSSTDLDYVCS